MSLEVTRKGISEILAILKKGEWQIPQFQREFIWSPEQVKNLINSFIKSYPIGLITIWDQPQNKPHTPGEPLKLKDGTEYKEYDKDPSVIKLVLDGKQRLTSLAMLFGGLHTRDDRYSYSGGWFVDIDALANDDETNIVKYKKQREISTEELTTLTVCVRRALIPLSEFDDLGDYLANINNPDIYPSGEYPSKEVRESRTAALNKLLQNYSQFQVPVAEIPSSVDLGSVCEIFDVLNTTGTKVSTFDLIHNLLFKFSSGKFLLRDNFKSYSDKDHFGNLCDARRQEYFNQLVTGCYLSENDPFKSSNPNESVTSIKGKDLIDTPLTFYQKIDESIDEIDNYAHGLFKDVLHGTFRLSEIPYPVQVVLYMSLRWHLAISGKNDDETINDLNKIFRAFFWRNTLTTRYDQGFLTQFSTDLRSLKAILEDNIVNRGASWAQLVNVQLDNLFGPEYQARSKDNLVEIVKDDDIKGALNQGITLLINSKATKDLLTGDDLDRFTDEKSKKVQLHHIFPRQWCRDNAGRHTIIGELGENNYANLIPLTASSNNNWKSKSPATAIRDFKIDFTSRSDIFEKGYIRSDDFAKLQNDEIKGFWESRAEAIADDLFKAQYVS